nr:MAG TPA: hypothetical protein [Caudoviricetes sp.]
MSSNQKEFSSKHRYAVFYFIISLLKLPTQQITDMQLTTGINLRK